MNLEQIDDTIINILIKKNDTACLLDYLSYIKRQLDKTIIDNIIKEKSMKILEELVENNLLNQHLTYYAIFMSQNLDLIKYIDNPNNFDFDVSLNYLKDIIENAKLRSFYFLYKIDQSILTLSFENGNNILHCLKYKNNKNNKNNEDEEHKNNTKDLIALIMNQKPELINIINDNKETPIVYHSKHNPDLIPILLEYDFDATIFDINGNTFLHNICLHDKMDILKLCLKQYSELINLPNKQLQTPAIIACINNKEDMFYVLKGMGADLLSKDLYGNSCYHYICNNSMCLGMIIENTENYFGFKPSNYCKISKKYYSFIE
jgi:hypothetical protein